MRRYFAKSRGFALRITFVIFLVLSAVMVAVALLTIGLHFSGIISVPFIGRAEAGAGSHVNPLRFIIPQMILCPFIGTAFARVFGKIVLRPLREFTEATDKIAAGDFSVKLDVRGITELEELGAAFNKMTDELNSIHLLQSDFINNFSHELKTPIVSLRGFAKLIRAGAITEEEKNKYLDIIVSESERLAELSTNILNLTKYESIDIITEQAEFRLDEQIRKAVLLTDSKWAAKHIDYDLCLEEISIISNEDMMLQIWLNLLDNAVKFSPEKSDVTIRLDRWNGKIRFIIRDSGPGIPPEALPHIFDKTYKMQSESRGSGLGLAIVRRIAELCGASVTAESAQQSGTVFTVII